MSKISKNQKDDDSRYIDLKKVYEIFIERILQSPFSYDQCFKILKNYVKLTKANKKKESYN